MAKTTLGTPIFSLTPKEREEMERRASEGVVLDALTQEMVDGPFSGEAIGARNSLMGAFAWKAGTMLSDMMGDTPKGVPLNLSKRKSEFDPMRDDISFSLGNNPETIAEHLKNVPYEEWPYLLSSGDLNTYENRYRFIMSAQPEIQSRYGSTAGKALGVAADITALTTLSLAAEPLVLSGLGVPEMAGAVVSASAGRDRVRNAAQAALEAVQAVSRKDLAVRYTALGMAEEVMYQVARNAVDETYDPSASEVVYGLALSGSLSGLVGGAMFGKTFVRENVEQTARDLIKARVTDLPGGYKVIYGRPYAFDSSAAADELLFAPGTGDLRWEADRIANDLWIDWNRSPKIPDFFIPGTRVQQLPVEQPVFLRDIDERTWEGVKFGEGIENVPTPRPQDLAPINTNTPEFKTFMEGSAVVNESGKPLKVYRGVSPNFRGFGEADGPIYFAADKGVAVRSGQVKGNEGGVVEVYLSIKNPYRTTDPDGVSFMTKARAEELQRQGYDGAVGQMAYGDSIEYVVFSPKQIRYARNTPTMQLPPVQGLRSAVKTAAFELSIAGLKLDAGTFSKIAQALVKVERTKVRMGAFNKALWEELIKEIPGEVVARLRPLNERAFIGGIDRSVMDLSKREDMVDSVWEWFRYGKYKEFEQTAPSLIFDVLKEIRLRGGTVNRNVVAEVIDELRLISQKPPKRINAKGREVLDLNARRAAVIDVINKRAKDGQQIHVNNALVARLNPPAPKAAKVRAADAGGGRAADGGEEPPMGGGGAGGPLDASDVPKGIPWITNIPILGAALNQAAYAHNSNNGWARWIANVSFNARRDFGSAQQYTIMEKGLQIMSSTLGSFSKTYRNNYIKFALGQGEGNVNRDINLADAVRTAFGSDDLKRQFHQRVAAQLRSGAFDDSVEAVNDMARSMRESFNKIHDIAHSAGLKGFQKAAVANYFPRLWRWDRIRRLASTPEGTAALKKLVKQSIDQNGRKVVLDGVEMVFTEDLDEAAEVFTRRLIAIADKTENAPTIAQEQELFDAIVALEGPLKDKVGSKSPFGRSRILLDETASVATASDFLNKGGLGLSLADLTRDDLPAVFQKYITSVLGATNEKRLINAFNDELAARGVMGPKTKVKGEVVQEPITVNSIDEMFATARKLGGAIDTGHESALRELVSAIRFEPIHHGRTAVTDKVLQIVLPLGYLSTGGQFGLAQIGEIARIVGTLGIRQTVEQMPILMEMLDNWRKLDKPTDNFASLVDAWFSPSNDRLRRVIAQGVGEMGADQYANPVARGLSSMANFMSDISLLAPATSFTQQLTAATSIQHLWEVSRGLSKRMDEATVRTLGLEMNQYEALIQYVGRNAETKSGFMGDRVVGMRNVDSIEMDTLKKFVDRMVRTRVQDMPTRGDFHKSMFSFVGKLMTQFRTFNLKGVDNFLMQNVSRTANGGGALVAQEIMATLVFAGVIQYGRVKADWLSYKAAGDREKMKELEARMDFTGFVRGAFTGPSEFFVPGFVMDTLWTKAFDKDPILSPYRYSGLNLYGFPGMAIGERAFGVAEDVYGATVGKTFGLDIEREVTRGTIHKARLLMPFQNMLFVKQFLNLAEDEIAEAYRLPDIQPRRPASN